MELGDRSLRRMWLRSSYSLTDSGSQREDTRIHAETEIRNYTLSF